MYSVLHNQRWLSQRPFWFHPEAVWICEMREAATLFKQGDDSRVPAIFHSLGITIAKLQREGAQLEELAPLLALRADLDRANHGRRMHHVRLRKGFSAIRPDCFDGSFIVKQATSLIVGEILFRAFGAKRGDRGAAEKAAAKLLSKYGFKTQVGRLITPGVLKKWRLDVSAGHEALTAAKKIFDDTTKDYPPVFGRQEGFALAEREASRIAASPMF